jgi:hypothetical protein
MIQKQLLLTSFEIKKTIFNYKHYKKIINKVLDKNKSIQENKDNLNAK